MFIWLLIFSSECINSSSLFVIDKPKTVPPNLLVVDVSSCENGSKIFWKLSSFIPMPVSLMAKWIFWFTDDFSIKETSIMISPEFVNFTALLIKF
jgi:hypothetical protein